MQMHNQSCRLETDTVPVDVYGDSLLIETGNYTLPIHRLIFSMLVGHIT